jgi:enoyl-CoA hydratase/carnithine racemase
VVSAEDAVRHGLANEVAPHEALLESALAWSDRIARLA